MDEKASFLQKVSVRIRLYVYRLFGRLRKKNENERMPSRFGPSSEWMIETREPSRTEKIICAVLAVLTAIGIIFLLIRTWNGA